MCCAPMMKVCLPKKIALEYPSLQLSVIYKVIAFYLEHREAVDNYVTEHDRIITEQMARVPTRSDDRRIAGAD